MNPRQSQWQLLGYCPGCKEEIYYNWESDTCNSSCSCDRHTTCRELLKKREEEDD
jgi:hypothetical protein